MKKEEIRERIDYIKKLKFRRTWERNPVQKIHKTVRDYSRADIKKELEEELFEWKLENQQID